MVIRNSVFLRGAMSGSGRSPGAFQLQLSQLGISTLSKCKGDMSEGGVPVTRPLLEQCIVIIL